MQPGFRFEDRFEVLDEIHVGGMSTVSFGRDHIANVSVAIKRPHASTKTERFLEEAAILQELSHPAIVGHVAHGGKTNEDHFLAMQWLEGESLFARLVREPLSLEHAIALGIRASQALAIVHRRKISHRDIKPANLFLVDSSPEKVTILDFGIARRELSKGLATHAQFAGGTWAYMSPEQAMGAAELGPRADVFALGCVLFECITGKMAYPEDRAGAMVAKVWEEVPRVRDFVPTCPITVDNAIAKLMAKDAAVRPVDGVAAAAELASLSGTY